MMNERSTEQFYARLTKRRQEIMMTLEHLQKQQRAVDENQEWVDQAAQESRINLLVSLNDWYTTETVQIDEALSRIARGKYGICMACHKAIEPRRLETAPEAAFCAGCQKTREGLGRT